MLKEGKIVFSAGKSGRYDIWLLDLATQELDQLTDGGAWNDCPKWSPDGKKILFVSNRTGSHTLWTMNEDGLGQTQIIKLERWHNAPSWSPDGGKIVFCANYDNDVNIYTVDAAGSNLQQITNDKGVYSHPTFSPDGRRIIFSSQRSGNDEIWVYDIVGGQMRQLTNGKGKCFCPVYSPDGKTIAFVCGQSTLKGEEILEIYLMDGSGGNIRKITQDLQTDRHVSWSPDGRFLIHNSRKITPAEAFAGSSSSIKRLTATDIATKKSVYLEFDREELNRELEEKSPNGGFAAFADSIAALINPRRHFGTERYPDWKI